MNNFKNEIYKALYNTLFDKKFVLSEFSFRGNNKDFEIEFVCYGIYRNRFKELLSEIKAIFVNKCSQKVFVDANQYAHRDYASFLITKDGFIRS